MAPVSSAATSEIGTHQKKGNDQVIEERHAGAGVSDLIFEAETAAGGVGVHDQDE
jgi:hypothetical protein